MDATSINNFWNQLDPNSISLFQQILNERQQPIVPNNQVQRESTLANVVREYRVNNHDPDLHIDGFLNEKDEDVNNILINSLNQFTSFKIQAVMCVQMYNENDGSFVDFYFHLIDPILIQSQYDINIIHQLEDQFNQRLDDLIAKGSG